MRRYFHFFIMFFAVSLIGACKIEPVQINLGKDDCSFCKMTISNARFAAEILTPKGKVYKYDDLHCLLSAVEKGDISKDNIHEIYLTDFSGKHELVNAKAAYFIMSEDLKSPMGGNIAAFSSKDSLLTTLQKVTGKQVLWEFLYH